MTIDEFLVSNKTSHEFDRDFVLKVKYNDNIDYIFKTNYGKVDFNSNLKCVGIFNKINNKLKKNVDCKRNPVASYMLLYIGNSQLYLQQTAGNAQRSRRKFIPQSHPS